MSFYEKLKDLFTIPTVKKANYDRKTEILTLTYTDGTVEQYHGNCTCWNRYPNMESVNVFKESELYRYWKYNKVHNKEYIAN